MEFKRLSLKKIISTKTMCVLFSPTLKIAPECIAGSNVGHTGKSVNRPAVDRSLWSIMNHNFQNEHHQKKPNGGTDTSKTDTLIFKPSLLAFHFFF